MEEKANAVFDSDAPRMAWVDCVRGFAILLVLIGHTDCFPDVKQYIYGFHMPLFFILSGFLFNFEKWQSAGFWTFFKSRVRCYLVPYFSLATICLCIRLALDHFAHGVSGNALGQSAISYVKWIFYSSTFSCPSCGYLWFLVALFVASLFLYGLMVLFKKSALSGFLGCFFAVLVNYDLNTFSMPFLPFHVDVAMIAALFMLVGVAIRKYRLLEKALPPYALIALFFIGSYAIRTNTFVDMNNRLYSNYVLMVVGAVFISFLIFYLFKKYSVSNHYLSFIGTNTILIFAFGPYAKILATTLFHQLPGKSYVDCPWYLIVLFNVAFLSVLVFIFNLLAEKLPFLNVLVGKKVTHKSERN